MKNYIDILSIKFFYEIELIILKINWLKDEYTMLTKKYISKLVSF